MKLKFWIFSVLALLTIVGISITACISEMEKEDLPIDNVTLNNRSSGGLLDLLGTDCFPSSVLDTNGCYTEFIDTLEVDSIPGYLDCTFTVIIRKYECVFSGILDLAISDYQILEHDCEDFSDDLANNLDPSMQFAVDFDELLLARIEEILIQEYIATSNFDCGNDLYIGFTYYRSSCFKVCVSKENWGRGRNFNTIYKIPCGTECCQRYTQVCQKPDGTLQISTTVTEPNDTSCPSGSSVSPDCYGSNVIYESDCTYMCQ